MSTRSLSRAIRFIYDSTLLAVSRQTLSRKASIWFGFAQLSLAWPWNGSAARVAGFKVSSFDRPTLAYLFREIFVRQVYRIETTNLEPLVLDCGANLGMATLFFKFLYPKCRVKCFEPDPSTFQLLEKNVEYNRLDGVELFNVALWDETGTIDFFCDSATRGTLLMSTNLARMKGAALKVPTRRLSEFIDEEVDYLKLDVEGAELRVMQELSDSGKLRNIREMAIEYHHRIPGEQSAMSGFLGILEKNHFEYQIVAGGFPDLSAPRFQDIMIYARRSG
jgi:FkbM family methyltransferase